MAFNMHQLSRVSKIWGTPASGATGVLNGDILDMATEGGFESVCFIGLATVTSTAQHLKMQQGTASGALSDTTGLVVHSSIGALVLDVYRPTQRFVRGVFTASGASSPHRAIIGIQYGGRSMPTTQESSGLVTQLYSPGTGTATG